MKKLFAILLALSVSAMLLAGCGDKDGTQNQTSGQDSTGTSTGAAAVSTPSNVQSNTDEPVRTTASDVAQVLVASSDVIKP